MALTYTVWWRFRDQYKEREFDDLDMAIKCFEGVGNDPYVEVELMEHITRSLRHSYRPAKKAKGT